jgi:hypothetical protein
MIALIKRFFKILFFSNLIIGLSAGTFSAGWSRYIGCESWLDYGLFSFFAALAVYNLDKLWKIQWVSKPSYWLLWIRKHQVTLWISTCISGILAFYILIWTIELKSYFTLIILCTTGIIAFLYSFPLQTIRLRNIPGAKAILIASVWVFILTCLPVINEHIVLTHKSLIFGSLFTFFLAITIPFDIRDIDRDSEKLKTIPQRFGIPKAKLFSYFALVISFIFAIFIYNFWINIYFCANYILLGFLVFLSNPQAKWWLYALIDCCIFLIGSVYFFCN